MTIGRRRCFLIEKEIKASSPINMIKSTYSVQKEATKCRAMVERQVSNINNWDDQERAKGGVCCYFPHISIIDNKKRVLCLQEVEISWRSSNLCDTLDDDPKSLGSWHVVNVFKSRGLEFIWENIDWSEKIFLKLQNSPIGKRRKSFDMDRTCLTSFDA